MSTSNDFQLDEPVEDFASAEGFARITRDGKSDIYVVQNQEYPGDYKVSLAFTLDDFEPGNVSKLYGEPLVLNALDRIEFLGNAQDYFIPQAPLWEDCLAVVGMNPNEIGLLPTVRAIEHLREKGKIATEQEIELAVKHYVSDYHTRRALLI